VKLLCPRFQTSLQGWSVWQLLPLLDVVSYYLVASSVLPLLRFRARKRKTSLRSPLTSDQNLEETRNKMSLPATTKRTTSGQSLGRPTRTEERINVTKIASEGWGLWFLLLKLTLRQICEERWLCVARNVMSCTKKYALLRKKEEIVLR
jgi:hypothetical protein